ncbi:uncharacterized protein LOC108910974 isoform X2 [Anoplophora glabripennis]|uniref:uncharacterized protein LOC108910974 isoform X2 n=1 Tax=Anoplophora glabripennis TaxID=217634 RepID=UPI000874EE4B|nr:uncharacterized protein LOC108910974 isoform X2 [Anoplophora glabripennis]
MGYGPLQRTTSTPLQREEPNLPEKSQEAITPVEFLDINRDKNYYTDCVSMKRKVTFCETPVAEKKEDILEIENMFEGQIIVTPSSANNSAVFYSAKQYPQENLTCHGDKNEISIYTDSKDIKFEEKREINNAEIGHEESVLWISAVNTSPDFIEGSKPFIDTNNFPTPSIAKLKKRQVNVVMPTAIRNQNVELELPSNMSLTTLNTSISEESTSEMQQDSFKPHLILKETSVNKVEYSSTDDTNGILAETSTNSASLWTSMSKIVKTVANVVQEFSSSTSNSKTPLKRIMEDDIFDGPHVKRYKLTEIKCRPPIRHLAIEYMGECKENLKYESSSFINRINKTFVDKATQTDEWFPQNC